MHLQQEIGNNEREKEKGEDFSRLLLELHAAGALLQHRAEDGRARQRVLLLLMLVVVMKGGHAVL